MQTLLTIYESFKNGQLSQFVAQVKEYGPADFTTDVQTDISDQVLTFKEGFKMLRTFINMTHN